MNQSADLAVAGLSGNRGVLSVEEIAICVAWLVLAGAMTWILTGPTHGQNVTDTSGQSMSLAVNSSRS